jgi:hypothetical protein
VFLPRHIRLLAHDAEPSAVTPAQPDVGDPFIGAVGHALPGAGADFVAGEDGHVVLHHQPLRPGRLEAEMLQPPIGDGAHDLTGPVCVT